MLERKYEFSNGKKLELGKKILVMGILNVTPDSFSDGGKWNTLDAALKHMEQMIDDGADIIDIGAESSRPGFQKMSAAEECERLLPFLSKLVKECPVPISIDTFKSQTAEMAVKEGVDILNDIWGLQYEAEPGEMAKVAAKYNLPVIVMHNQDSKVYDGDMISSMKDFFRRSIGIAKKNGLDENNIIFDPGIGFGKDVEGNLEALRRQQELLEIDGKRYPLLLGPSRKSFIGVTMGLPVEERMEATGAACVYGIMNGADIVRVHDVKPIARMCKMIDVIEGRDRAWMK